MSNLTKHLKTVRIHRKYVRKLCFAVGLYWQGLTHDLSKYSFAELSIYKYYSGTKSPHQNCRDVLGYSPSWNHHYHKNKHHFQYWWDEDEEGNIIPVKMPFKYVVESFCDMVGAGKAYLGKKWSRYEPLRYYNEKCKGKRIMHPDSIKLLEKFLNIMDQYGEKEFVRWFKLHKYKLEKTY